jgi:hypothetical protein
MFGYWTRNLDNKRRHIAEWDYYRIGIGIGFRRHTSLYMCPILPKRPICRQLKVRKWTVSESWPSMRILHSSVEFKTSHSCIAENKYKVFISVKYLVFRGKCFLGSVDLLGQLWVLQLRDEVADPTQFFPRYWGAGFVHVLLRVWVPPPQVTVQPPYDPQDAHLPSTETIQHCEIYIAERLPSHRNKET